MNQFRTLVDLDVIVYRGLFALKDQNYYKQLRACDNILYRIMDRFGDDMTLVLTGSNNFRYQISKAYKANRKPESRPTYLQDARNYFVKYWNAVVTDGFEADDFIGMNHSGGSVIVTSDKDMNQLGGNIYNPFRDELYFVDNPDFYFYYQMLVGDASDNISGIHGIGDKKARKWLEGKDKESMRFIVKSLYQRTFGDAWQSTYDTNARLIFLLRDLKSQYYEYY